MNIKVIISIVLLIAAAGIFYWVYGIDRVPEAAQRGQVETFERDRAILEIGDGYGGGSCTQRQHAEKQNKGSGLKKTTEHIRNLKEDGVRLPSV